MMKNTIARKNLRILSDLVIYILSYTIPYIFLQTELFSSLLMSEVFIMSIDYTSLHREQLNFFLLAVVLTLAKTYIFC
jgi:hypothetical protein